jgi:predicted Rossmann fold flavoprotein
METFGGFLFTHRGYSGPAVLDISHVTSRLPSEAWAKEGGDNPIIRAQWSTLDAAQWEEQLQEPARRLVRRSFSEGGSLGGGGSLSVTALVAKHIPARLADHLVMEAGIPADRRTSSLKRSERLRLIDALTAYPLSWSGNEGYKKAEVTGGGVALGEVDPKTLESKRVAGLYLCGEMLDAFGPIGGHNFSWAWATGRAAGIAAGTPGSSGRRTNVERAENAR